MKTTLPILLLIFSSYSMQAQTNAYQPYPSDNVSLTMHTQYYDGTGLVENWDTKTWSGDTIIGGVTYTRVFNDPFMVGVRQDILNEQIFYIDDQGIEYDASFDQSAQVGDTVLLSLPFKRLNMYSEGMGIIDDSAVVQAVDSILIGSNYHKRLRLTTITTGMFFDGDYICGMSCTNGTTSISSSFGVVCYYVDGFQLIGNPSNPECTADVEELTMEEVSIYPNPTKGHFYIDAPENAQLQKIYISNLSGKRLQTLDPTQLQNGFDIANYPQGMYIVELIFDRGVARRTLIK